ncbi:hypothetical protein [Frondihabitans cladoniiphilus]|uniref:Uncharacterized protein n=1 Tax=Frondihabitans cladoniiphilus TaxID=715785 RepID=A0ABP8W6Y7_9MICO
MANVNLGTTATVVFQIVDVETDGRWHHDPNADADAVIKYAARNGVVLAGEKADAGVPYSFGLAVDQANATLKPYELQVRVCDDDEIDKRHEQSYRVEAIWATSH